MKSNGKKRGTKTSSFGAPGRINHDSSTFYSTKLYEGLPKEKLVKYAENEIKTEHLNNIFCNSSEKMKELPDSSVHLMVTSPPYNVGKEYDEDYSLRDYLLFLKNVWREVHRVLVPGGRVCINVANLGRKPYIPLHAYIIEQMLELEFLMRGEVIWNKASSASPSTAWGSWRSPTNPTLRDIHEYLLIFSKGTYSRPNTNKREISLAKEEFMEYTKSIWTFKAESARRIGHPAPFPVELPLRVIKLYTFEDEIVLDPFMGSGQTAIAAITANRHYIGYDIDSDYVQLAKKRIDVFDTKFNSPQLFNDLSIARE